MNNQHRNLGVTGNMTKATAVDDILFRFLKTREKSKRYKMKTVSDRYMLVAIAVLVIGTLIAVIPLIFLPIADVVVGAIYVHSCQANTNIVLSVLLMGVFQCLFFSSVIILLFLVMSRENSKGDCHGYVSAAMAVVALAIFLASFALFLYCCYETFRMVECDELVLSELEMSNSTQPSNDLWAAGELRNTTQFQQILNNSTILTDLSCFTTNKTFANTEIYCEERLYNFAFGDLIVKFVLTSVWVVMIIAAVIISQVGDTKESGKENETGTEKGPDPETIEPETNRPRDQ